MGPHNDKKTIKISDQLHIVFDLDGKQDGTVASVGKWLEWRRDGDPLVAHDDVEVYEAWIGRNKLVKPGESTTFGKLFKEIAKRLEDPFQGLEASQSDDLRIVFYNEEGEQMKATTSIGKWLEGYKAKEDFLPGEYAYIYSARVNGVELANPGVTKFGELMRSMESYVLGKLSGSIDKAIERLDGDERQKASELPVVKLDNKRKGEASTMGENKSAKAKEPSITAILKGYSEVTIKQNGLMISFESKEDILEAFKALTAALDKADKEAIVEEMGFTEDKR